MANPTTNYGFVLPTPTDLVTDLPADFDVALQGVDTRLKALQPGTTLGDLAYSSATANTNTRLGIGTTGQVLTVSGGVPAWVSAGGGDANYTLLNSGGTSLSGSTTTVTFTAHNSLLITIENLSATSNNAVVDIRFNSDTGSNYYASSWYMLGGSTGSFQQEPQQETRIRLLRMDQAGETTGAGSIQVWGAKSSGQKPYNLVGRGDPGGNTNARAYVGVGRYSGSSAITSVSIISGSGTFDNGTVFIYGSN